MANVSLNQFSSTIQQMLKQYGDEVKRVADDLIPDAADKAAKQIKATSRKRTGKYAKGWSKKLLKKRRTGDTWVVYNRTEYRVAHLLENDHVFKAPNGKVVGNWHGDGVIAQAEDDALVWIADELHARLE